ncbi:unnamed protein product, partial [Iphiclides podalirius]
MPNNVGTVLYTAKDRTRTNWSIDELALIHARIYAQKLLPPMNTGVVVNEAYVKTLLVYFKEIYKTVKIESPDARIGDIMTAAVSDALGGFVKSWVLPVTKFAFYGGTVSKDSAQRVVNFYNDVKKFLSSDGSGWRAPDLKELRYVAVNIAPPPALSNARIMKDPCDNLAYLEKTDKGLKIPIPSVTWDNGGAMMFLPLRKRSLISLNSLTSANALLQYYDAAKRCAKTASVSDEADFDKRFESWLIYNVLPHLNDENLYYGLDSVLCLVNKTRDVCDKITSLYMHTNNTHSLISNCSGSFASKKVIFVTIVLFLEICWCIPAMFYLKCSRNKKRTRSKDNFLSVCLSYDEKSVNGVSVFGEVRTRSKHGKEDHGVKFQQKTRLKNKLSGPHHDPIDNSPARLTKSAGPRLAAEPILKSSSSKTHPHTDKQVSGGLLKIDPYCVSVASINTSSSRNIAQKRICSADEIPPAKTITLFKNTHDQRKVCISESPKVEVKRSMILRQKSKHANIKEVPIVLKDSTQTSSVINTKITRILVARDEEDDEKIEKYYDAHKQIKTVEKNSQSERIASKPKTIIMSRKGTKSNVEKPYFGIKIDPQEADMSNLECNEKPLYATKLSKNPGASRGGSRFSAREIKMIPDDEEPTRPSIKDTLVSKIHENRICSVKTETRPTDHKLNSSNEIGEKEISLLDTKSSESDSKLNSTI